MMVLYLAVAVLCLGNSVLGDFELPTGPTHPNCNAGECAIYIANANDNQCGYTNTHLLLAHPTDCHRYCRCDHSGTAICEMPCAPGTRFSGELQVCVHDDGCSGDCGSDPCVHSQSCATNLGKGPALPTDWTCQPCDNGCWGWNCQFCNPPCNPDPCPPGLTCIAVTSQWWPVKIPYTCVPDPCDPDPCNEGGTCVPTNNGQDFYCECPAICFGKTCDCFKPDPCDTASNCLHGSCSSPTYFPLNCDGFTCTCDVGWSGPNCDIFDGCDANDCANVNHANVAHPSKCDHYCACGFGTVNQMPCAPGTYFSKVTCECTDLQCLQ